MATDDDLRVGTRVRYLFGDKATGTVVEYVGGRRKYGDWLVRWDDDTFLEAYAANMEVLTHDVDSTP